MAFFIKKGKNTLLKFVQSHKRSQIAKALLRKKNKAGAITIPASELQNKAIELKHIGTGIGTGHRPREQSKRAKKQTHAYSAP